jgi:hypothetical protein
MLDKLPMREQRKIVMQKVDELNRKANTMIARNQVPLTIPVDSTENMQLFVL